MFFFSSGNTVICNKAVKNKTEYFVKTKPDRREVSGPVDMVDMPSKAIGEIRKSFENIKAPVNVKDKEDGDVIPPNLVREMRKSFENMPLPDPPSEQVNFHPSFPPYNSLAGVEGVLCKLHGGRR